MLPSKETAVACQLLLHNKESTSERYYQKGIMNTHNRKESFGHTLGQSRETNPGDFTDQRGMGLQYLPPVFQHDSPAKGTVCCQFKKIKDWFCVATKRDRATCSGILGGMFTQPPVCQLLQVCSHTVTAPLTDPAENQHRKDNFQTGEAEGRVSPSLFTSMGRTTCLW